jgi:peroxiredoxin
VEAAVTNLESETRVSLLSRRRLTQGVTLFLVLGLCVSNWLLIKQNRDLKAAIAHNNPEFLLRGQELPALTGKTLSGQRKTVNYAESNKTVFLVFSPACPACEQAAPSWRDIIAACSRNQYQIFGISLDFDRGSRTRAFLISNGFSMETFVDIDGATKATYRLSLTPLTIVIDNKGKVDRVWPGAFDSKVKVDVEKYFGISTLTDVE